MIKVSGLSFFHSPAGNSCIQSLLDYGINYARSGNFNLLVFDVSNLSFISVQQIDDKKNLYF